MSRIDELTQENERLRERMARLSEASLRVSESLDLEMVLREVVESARVLTGAANAVITTVDRVKGVRDFISSGLTPEERRQLHDLPEGERLWGYLLQSPRPLRVDDLAAHLDSLGFPTAPILRRSFLGAPIRHRGVNVGHFYFTNKEGGQQFTEEDEETLVLFASQAATAIANARAYHDEQRARADLEALIETSPFGVVVLAARSGEIVSINSEARRMVADLLSTGGSLREAQEAMVVRRADGTEVSLAEFSLAEALGSAEVVRVEEMVLSVPGGSAVRALVNATPIHGEDGEVASMVVTMQDLAPLEELERQRTEFLSMVGQHVPYRADLL